MKERRKPIKLPSGEVVEGTVVDVASSTEKFSEYLLSDGTKLRAKLAIFEAVRHDENWDSEGNPVYIVRSQNVVVVVDAPKKLKKKEN